jgi:hypothetical protein
MKKHVMVEGALEVAEDMLRDHEMGLMRVMLMFLSFLLGQRT